MDFFKVPLNLWRPPHLHGHDHFTKLTCQLIVQPARPFTLTALDSPLSHVPN